MRVLLVSSLWPPAVLGGAEIYAERLAGALAARGHEVGALTLGVDGPGVVATVRPWPYRPDAYAQHGGWRKAAMHVRSAYDPVTAAVLRRTVAGWRPDVVHSHSVPGLSVAALLARGPARVHHLHDWWLLCERTTLHRDGRDCVGVCTGCAVATAPRRRLLGRRPPERVISVSDAVTRRHAADLPWLAERATTLHLPADPVAGPSGLDRRPPGRPVRFGYLGQLSEAKGVLDLLDAFAALPPGAATLAVGGRGPLDDEVRRRAAGLPGVDVVGFVAGEAREAFFADVDCLVVPSRWQEPGGLVASEARARGLPVVATAVGGLPETVDAACRPLLAAPGDVGALTRSLAAYATAPSAHAPVDGPPTSWAEHAAAVEAVYGEAVAAGR